MGKTSNFSYKNLDKRRKKSQYKKKSKRVRYRKHCPKCGGVVHSHSFLFNGKVYEKACGKCGFRIAP